MTLKKSIKFIALTLNTVYIYIKRHYYKKITIKFQKITKLKETKN